MRERRWGRVITVQSRAVRESIPDLFASNATRPGAAGLMKDMAREQAPYGILFNTIVPGRIMTARFRGGIAESKAPEDYIRSKMSDIPVQRFGTPEDIAGAVTFLASEQASYINGVALAVDGGVIRGL
jgi:3-oxoacyl-[acyl-carrier protein] reductase